MREIWKSRGAVEVSRDSRGRFLKWTPLIFLDSIYGGEGKEISVYGYAHTSYGSYPARYHFWGNGYELERSMRIAYNLPPKGHVIRVSARDFLNDPYRYGVRGYWTERRVES